MKRFRQFLLEKKMKNPFNPITTVDFRKDENRVLTFLQKIKDGEPFATVKDGEVTIPKTAYDEVQIFIQADKGVPAPRTNIMIPTSAGKLPLFNRTKGFLKTGEFGGRGAGSGTNAETIAMNHFNKGLNKILVKERVSQISLKINGRTVMCAAMVKTEGKFGGYEPKSDMTIVDMKGEAQAYISHKAGRSAKDYQQYGGVSDKALPSKYHNNADIKDFMKTIIALRPEGLKTGDSFYRPLKDENLVKMMMYGPKFGSLPSISNVDEFHLGNMTLKGRGEGPYTIESIHKGTNGDFPKGEFEAVLFARFQGKRGNARAAGEELVKARVGIFPMAKLSRTTKKV